MKSRELIFPLVFAIFSLHLFVSGKAFRNFYTVGAKAGGVIEKYIKYDGITAKETLFTRKNFKLRQLSHGKHFMQLMYKRDMLTDCEYAKNKTKVSKFHEAFRTSVRSMRKNATNLDEAPLPKEFAKWLNYPRLRRACLTVTQHKHTRKARRHLHAPQTTTSTEWPKFEKKEKYGGDLLIVPGTKWCGKGWSAKKYSHLGGHSEADKCCRNHDLTCAHYIQGMQMKYGLFNWRINTLMHCSCDIKFRSCLKMSDTPFADFVGNLFFNYVQTKCFTFKSVKKCVKKTWRGKCVKYVDMKEAVLRDNPSY